MKLNELVEEQLQVKKQYKLMLDLDCDFTEEMEAKFASLSAREDELEILIRDAYTGEE